MTRTRIMLVALAALAVAVLAACGNGAPVASSGGGPGGGQAAGCSGSAAATVTGTVGATVQQTDALKFNPNKVSIQAGQVVQWKNTSSAPHNVTFDNCASFNSQTMQNGDTWEVLFSKPGTYGYQCTIHPGMTATIVVT